MAGEAGTVAVAELGADISDVVAFGLSAAQHAIRCRAGNTAIDENKTHHVSLRKIESRLEKRLRHGVTSVRPFADKDSDRMAAIPVIATW
ncbi:MAG: hypothetical protein WBD11_15405 [Xanthobacteraceae bacterium]